MHPVEVLLTPLGKAFRNRHAEEKARISRAAALQTANRISLSSPGFGDGAQIPARHCGWLIGDNISPALSRGALPAGTAGLLLVMEDLNGPGAAPRIHAIAAFPPAAGGLADGALAPDAPGVRFLSGRRGPGRYAGPRPGPRSRPASLPVPPLRPRSAHRPGRRRRPRAAARCRRRTCPGIRDSHRNADGLTRPAAARIMAGI